MTIITYEIIVTHRYLMHKSKSYLSQWFDEQCRELAIRVRHDDFTKEDYAHRIMKNIGILEQMDRVKRRATMLEMG